MRSVLVTYGGGDRIISNVYGYKDIWVWGNGGRDRVVLECGPNHGHIDLDGDHKGQGRGGNSLWVRNLFQ